MTGPSPTETVSTETVAAVQHQRRRLRHVRRWLVVALVCVAMLGLLGLTAVRRDAASLLQPESFLELLTWFGIVLVVVVIVLLWSMVMTMGMDMAAAAAAAATLAACELVG